MARVRAGDGAFVLGEWRPGSHVRLDRNPMFFDAGTVRLDSVFHVLAEDQAALSTRFARRGEDKFLGLRWQHGLEGVPVLPDYLVLWECRLTMAYEGGDHLIAVGQVERITLGDISRPPLGFFRSKYIQVHRHPAAFVPEEVIELWGMGWA